MKYDIENFIHHSNMLLYRPNSMPLFQKEGVAQWELFLIGLALSLFQNLHTKVELLGSQLERLGLCLKLLAA